jgi:hypothetical protein
MPGKGNAHVAGRPRRLLAFVAASCGLSLGLTGGGCAFGPKVLEKTHGLYNEAVRRVDEEQLLRNIVRLRYNETGLELNVSSIASQYELAAGVEARPFFGTPNPAGNIFHPFTRILPDATLDGSNRPTITLIPADNGDAVQRFLTPISSDTLIFLSQTSWPVSMVMRLWLERANGVPNAPSASGPLRGDVPDFERFRRVAELAQMARLLKLATVRPDELPREIGSPLPLANVTGAMMLEAAKNGMEYRLRESGNSWALIRKEHGLVLEIQPSAVGHPIVNELETLLNLRPGSLRYEIVVAQGIEADPLLQPIPLSDELRLSTRSTAQVLYFLANGVEVPYQHQADGVAQFATAPDGTPFDSRTVTDGLFTVHSCKTHKPPATAYVAIFHRGYWFYIDDRDHVSKAAFTLVLATSRLDFARQHPAAGPFLTLPVGR